MSNQINLVSHKKKKLWNRELLLRFSVFLSRIAIVVIIICSIVLFILNRSGNLPILLQQDKTVTSNLTFVQQKIIKFLLIRERLQNIGPLVNTGSKTDVLIGTISSAIPSGVTLNSFSLDSKKISMSISSPSLSSVSNVLDVLIDKVNQKDTFKKLTISNFSAAPTTGSYSLTMDLEYYE